MLITVAEAVELFIEEVGHGRGPQIPRAFPLLVWYPAPVLVFLADTRRMPLLHTHRGASAVGRRVQILRGRPGSASGLIRAHALRQLLSAVQGDACLVF